MRVSAKSVYASLVLFAAVALAAVASNLWQVAAASAIGLLSLAAAMVARSLSSNSRANRVLKNRLEKLEAQLGLLLSQTPVSETDILDSLSKLRSDGRSQSAEQRKVLVRLEKQVALLHLEVEVGRKTMLGALDALRTVLDDHVEDCASASDAPRSGAQL